MRKKLGRVFRGGYGGYFVGLVAVGGVCVWAVGLLYVFFGGVVVLLVFSFIDGEG